jgi:glycosyltransferase involved in cell wall biosynthesis
MKVALYYPWIYLRGGAERALLETVTRSRHDWTIYTNHFEPQSTFPEFSELNVVPLSNVPVRRDMGSVFGAAMTVALQKVDFERHDRAVVFSEGLGNLMARRIHIPTTCVCLTPLKVAYDEITNQRFFLNSPRRGYRAAFVAYRAVDRRTWHHYDKVFCISEAVRKRIVNNRLVDPAKLEVIYPGVDHTRFHPMGRSDPYFLLPGRIMWQKNIELALESWRFFKPHPSDNQFRLVIAGMVDEKSRPYLEALRRSVAWRCDVEFVMSPTDDALCKLYQESHAVLFTAPSEDFGLVPLEAMACGKTVVAPGRDGPAETIVNGSTGLLVPNESRSYAAAIRTLAFMPTDVRNGMERDARARALQFDWSRFVRPIDDHLDRGAERITVRPVAESAAS